MISTKQKLAGLFISLLGAGGTVAMWYQAIYDGKLYEASVPFPGFAVLGLAAVFLPDPKQERLSHGEDVSNLRGWKLLTPVWRVVLIVTLVAALGNYLLLRLSFNWSE